MRVPGQTIVRVLALSLMTTSHLQLLLVGSFGTLVLVVIFLNKTEQLLLGFH